MFFRKIIIFLFLLKDNYCLSNPNLQYLLTYPSLSKTVPNSEVADSIYNENIEFSNILTPKPSEFLQPPPIEAFSSYHDDQAYIAQDQNVYQSIVPKKKTILVYPKKYMPEPKKNIIIAKKPIYMEPENIYIKPSSYQYMIKPNKSDLLTDYGPSASYGAIAPNRYVRPQKIEMAELVPITYAPSGFEANSNAQLYKEPQADYSYDESYSIIPKYQTTPKYVQETYLPNTFDAISIPKFRPFEQPEKYRNAYIPEQYSTESVNNYEIYSVTPKYQNVETSSKTYQNSYIPEQYTTESIKNYNVYPVTPKYHKLETSTVRYLPQEYTTEPIKDYEAYSVTPKYRPMEISSATPKYRTMEIASVTPKYRPVEISTDAYSITPKYHPVETSTESFRNVPPEFKNFGSIYKNDEKDYRTYAAVPSFDSYSLVPQFSEDEEDEEIKANEFSTLSQNVNYNPTEGYAEFDRNRFVKKEKPFSKNPFLNSEYQNNPFLNSFDQAKLSSTTKNANIQEKRILKKKKKYSTIPHRFSSSHTPSPNLESSTFEDRQFTITENPKKIFITTENLQSSTAERIPRKHSQNFEKKYDTESESANFDPAVERELNQEASILLSNVSPSQYNNVKNDRLQFQMHGHQGPHSYKFGFDTGKGHERQFRYEERDKEGVVKGHYGFYDKEGKLRVVNYDSDPHTGFHAHPEDTE